MPNALVPLLVTACLAGCGFKAPLYLPSSKPGAQRPVPPPATTPEAIPQGRPVPPQAAPPPQ